MTTITMQSTLRLFSKNPAFCATVIAIMALTIGSCTAIFSLVKSALFFDLPYRNVDRMVVIRHADARTTDVLGVWARDYLTYRDTTQSLETVAAFTTDGYNLSSAAEPARISCSRVTANLLPMLGVAPIRGRWFADTDDRSGAGRTVILSHDAWRVHFGSDPALLGKTIALDLQPHTVIGIMPPDVAFPPKGLAGPLPMRGVPEADCLIPAAFTQAEMTLPAFNWIVLGKLKPGVSIGEARQDAALAAERIWQSYPAAVQKEVELRARVAPLREEMTAATRAPVLLFAGAVGFLLLIGCANVANLWLGKLHVRQRDMAIRTALGASRVSLVMQLLMECVALAVCGGVLGIPLAFGIVRLLLGFNPGKIPLPDQIHIDVWTLLFTAACSVASGIVFGLAPALKARTVNVAKSIMDGERSASAALRHSKLRSMLAVVEIGMAFVLLAGAGLLMRSFVKLSNVHPGFDANNVVTFALALPEGQYPSQTKVDQFANNVLRNIQRANVNNAAAATSLPIGPTDYAVFARPDAPPAVAGFKTAALQVMTPGYLPALGIALERGRQFEAADEAGRAPVALVNETMARQYWPDTDVIGRQLNWVTAAGIRVITIVGVVADSHQGGLAQPAAPSLFVPLAQSPVPTRNLVFAVRSALPVASIAAGIRRAVNDTDRALPVFALEPASELISRAVGAERFNTFVVSLFAASALALAVLGLYAVISHLVVHSVRELGIRIALGATPGKILGMVMARGCGYVAAGLILGIAAALSLTHLMRTLLFGIDGADATTFISVSIVLSAVTLLAVLIPAIRATRIDPTVSLRQL